MKNVVLPQKQFIQYSLYAVVVPLLCNFKNLKNFHCQDDVPGAIGGVLCDENYHKSSMVQEAQQVSEVTLNKSNQKKPKTSGIILYYIVEREILKNTQRHIFHIFTR
jgi:hypothetical protein